MEIFMIAFRNVFRNPRRSLLNILAIAIGVMVIVNLQGWIRGFTQTVYQTQIDLDTGHVQVLNKNYEDEQQRLPLDLRVKDWTAVKTAVKDLPGLTGVTARIDFPAEITNGKSGIRVMARGVDPEGEAKVTNLKTNIVDGGWFSDSNGLIIGKVLAQKLDLHVGDQVFLNALDQYGVRNLVDGKVVGIFSFGYELFDSNLIYTTLSKAQETLALESTAATRVVLRFADSTQTKQETALVNKKLETDGLLKSADLSVYEWREFAQTVVSSIESRVRIMTFMLSILVILVIVGILNSMSMAVQERFREIGTLRAIGMNRRKLTQLFLAEGFGLGLLGGFAGILLGGTLAIVFTINGVDPRGLLPKDLPIPFTTVMRPLYTIFDFPAAILLSALCAVFGSFLPARRAGKMLIRDALGSHG